LENDKIKLDNWFNLIRTLYIYEAFLSTDGLSDKSFRNYAACLSMMTVLSSALISRYKYIAALTWAGLTILDNADNERANITFE